MTINEREVAIIGSGCRFPGGANNPAKLWALLCDPANLSRDIPNLEGYYHQKSSYHGHSNVREAYLLHEDTARQFDAAFFGVNPVEANVMDPQIRLLLEVVYEALEAGGQTVDGLKGSDTAVYAGQMMNDYEQLMLQDYDNLGTYHATGTSRAMLSNRISYFFDWHGPSITVDTACSSSLVALDHAVQQLRSGRSRTAIVAGSNLIFNPTAFIAESNLQMLSAEGKSRMWDAKANGYARGDGVAAVVLKMRCVAEADGDPIECVIRETAVNQDGKTSGPTMPSATAQTHLIQQCYDRAGLSLLEPSNYPQFFEAHGTGTAVGDPIEAEAIHSAFFPEGLLPNGTPDTLFVGSIKTVIGHTESTAGLAGLLKASLLLQHATIPPNLHFSQLNPRIEPYRTKLLVPTSLIPWPSLDKGGRRRVSVNSFGFGGTNAHAILENYAGLIQGRKQDQIQQIVFRPFTFSAATESSLRSYLRTFCDYLHQNKDVDPRNLAYSLDKRRTRLPIATAIGACNIDDLRAKIENNLQASELDSSKVVGLRSVDRKSPGEKPHILAIFTGQGAQWPQMGYDLITQSPSSLAIIQRLQARLNQLPAADRPKWSIREELRKGIGSRVMEATLSQPLCTAIQILQVELVRAAGIHFTAVVGHSSGEIAACYAAGLISAEDAICIAYYRGLFSDNLKGQDGKPGAMMAVGTSVEDAQELLEFPEFQGRACVACVNSVSSVTISGDRDAIEELKIIFEDEKKFARILKLDQAYHSHHTTSNSTKYLHCLKMLDIQINQGGQHPPWFSTLDGLEVLNHESLNGFYWVRNMEQPVLFMQAIQCACRAMGAPDLVIELGPHSTLRSPVLQNIQDVVLNTVPYTSLFRRGISCISAMADGLGYAWTHLGKGEVNLQQYDCFISGTSEVNFVKGLPTYSWNHEKEYWHESRYAKAVRTRSGPVHELLGHMTPDSTDHDIRWRQILRLSEIEWLSGHQLQNLVVFPATGYIVSVAEAALTLCQNEPVKLIELLGMNIMAALVFEPSDLEVEVILSLTGISRTHSAITADFKYHAGPALASNPLELKVSGQLRIQLGQPSHETLPSRPQIPPTLLPVSASQLYRQLLSLGYQYGGTFATLERLYRKLGAATGFVSLIEPTQLLVHPGALDSALQSMFLTYYSIQDDGTQLSMHLPRRIERVTINPHLCQATIAKDKALRFDTVHTEDLPHQDLHCNINIYPESQDSTIIQIQGLSAVPIVAHTSLDDREVFSRVVWDVADPNASAFAWDEGISANESKEGDLLDRIACLYLVQLKHKTPTSHRPGVGEPYYGLYQLVDQITLPSSMGEPPYQQPLLQQDEEITAELFKDSTNKVDIKILSQFGKNLVAIVNGERQATDVAIEANLTEEWYMNGLELKPLGMCLSRLVKQVVHRYPHMNILELASSMGAATKAVLQEVGPSFASYTVAAPNPALWNPEQKWLEAYKHKISFKPLDLALDLLSQGFAESTYDLIVAPLSLHGETNIAGTLQNVRALLNPGGRLIVLELSSANRPYYSLVCGLFSHWRHGDTDSRASIGVSMTEWDRLLLSAGFSGIDTEVTKTCGMIPFTVFISQAVDDMVSFLRNPLRNISTESAPNLMIEELIIIHDANRGSKGLVDENVHMLEPHCHSVRVISSLGDVPEIPFEPDTVILCLIDINTSVLQNIMMQEWAALKKILLHTGVVVWVTQGRNFNNPYANMILGLMRGASRDNPALNYLLLDFEDIHVARNEIIAECLLRHVAILQSHQRDNIQFSQETELLIDQAGRHLIPRIMMDREMNDRYNSNLREIRSQVNPSTFDLHILSTASEYDIVSEPRTAHRQTNAIHLRTTHSLLLPIRVLEYGYVHLVIGDDIQSSNKWIALSNTNSSVVSPPTELATPITATSSSQVQLLWLTAQHLLAVTILSRLSKDDRVLILNANPQFASIIDDEAVVFGVRITFAATDAGAARRQGQKWVEIHQMATRRELERLTWGGFSAFIDMTPRSELESVGDQIALMLPPSCLKETMNSLTSETAWISSIAKRSHMKNSIEQALARALTSLTKARGSEWEAAPTLLISDLPRSRDQPVPFTVVDWVTDSQISVRVRPVDSKISFPGNRTYWLVGLTGDLGLSLCEWMLQHGARYFVLTSRKPKVQSAWLDDMRARESIVRVTSCDITQRDQVATLYDDICSTMPPIAGVAQGAMVLQDTAIQDMTLEQLLNVTSPKVEGSVHINELFQTNTLDFFIFFSSAVAIVGNHGQANYAAANTFMAGLAQQRRKRGLAASVIDIGPVFDIGYLTKTDEDTEMGNISMQKGGLYRMSTRDVHQIFAEAVLAGRCGSNTPIELVSGIRRVSSAENHMPTWESWPIMSHLIKHHRDEIDATKSAVVTNVPIKLQLESCQSSGEIQDVIRNAFIHELELLFQLDADKLSKSELDATRFDQLGIDSITAVEIRGWFMKTLEVNIPILKVLNGGSVIELVSIAVENLPARFTPRLTRHDTKEVEDTPTVTSQQEYDKRHDLRPIKEPSVSDTNSSQRVTMARDFGLEIERSIPVSFTQARFYPSGFFLEDPFGLNHTAWARIMGTIDPKRLEQAVLSLTRQHEILRTAFFDHDGLQMQHILKRGHLQLKHQQISHPREVAEISMSIQKRHMFDVSNGKTAHMVLLTQTPLDNFLIVGLHPLVLDGTSMPTLMKWLAFHYANPLTQHQVKQFRDASQQQRFDYEAGNFENDLQYWREEFPTPPAPLPLMTLSKVCERPVLKVYENIRAACRIGPAIKAKVLNVCRRLRATPFLFYMATLRVLLLRLTVGGEDVTFAVAESGRGHDATNMDVIGPLYNLVLVRLFIQRSIRFSDLVKHTRDKTYAALEHSKLPYPILVEKLKLQENSKYFPFFQVFVDFRMGQREMIPWGKDNKLLLMGFDLNVPYDVYLDTIDELEGDCAHHFFFRKDLFDQAAADKIAKDYEQLVCALAEQPDLVLADIKI
ncbi:putative Acetyl- synthetase-like protein [Rosellinia necatrix]|uniref:Putative Acetyl-synthetase-like protein n=1 Tax=Rosellinia necatrix TaxID=77044 RepID=A0A1S7UNQ3_ROSNE|nr:putative Acetyl- synthetase-like protein [Rosellinia necatrix]